MLKFIGYQFYCVKNKLRKNIIQVLFIINLVFHILNTEFLMVVDITMIHNLLIRYLIAFLDSKITSNFQVV